MINKKYLKWSIIIIATVVGAMLSTNLYFPLWTKDIETCPKEEVLTSENAPGCINHEGELQGTGGWYCRDGNIYKQIPTRCITDKVYFLVNPIIKNLPPDTGGVMVYLLLIYGALVGALIGWIINAFTNLPKKKR